MCTMSGSAAHGQSPYFERGAVLFLEHRIKGDRVQVAGRYIQLIVFSGHVTADKGVPVNVMR
jgi:hypothetical protein